MPSVTKIFDMIRYNNYTDLDTILSSNCDIYIKRKGASMLYYAIEYRSKECFDLMLKKFKIDWKTIGIPFTGFEKACEYYVNAPNLENKYYIEELIKKGINISKSSYIFNNDILFNSLIHIILEFDNDIICRSLSCCSNEYIFSILFDHCYDIIKNNNEYITLILNNLLILKSSSILSILFQKNIDVFKVITNTTLERLLFKEVYSLMRNFDFYNLFITKIEDFLDNIILDNPNFGKNFLLLISDIEIYNFRYISPKHAKTYVIIMNKIFNLKINFNYQQLNNKISYLLKSLFALNVNYGNALTEIQCNVIFSLLINMINIHQNKYQFNFLDNDFIEKYSKSRISVNGKHLKSLLIELNNIKINVPENLSKLIPEETKSYELAFLTSKLKNNKCNYK
jgi:hypothetical protein